MLAVELTSWKPYLRQLLDEDNNHCTSGGAPLELWYQSVFVSLRDPSLCRVIQVQIDLLFGLNLHTTSEMKYFFKKIFYLVPCKHPRASLVCSVPSP